MGGVCPLTGEPLAANETISRAAVARVRTAVSDLPELLADLDYASAGLRHGDSGPGGVAGSKEPVNLGLVLEMWEVTDLLQVWASALVSHVMGPKYWVRRGDWVAVKRTFQAYADLARTWVEAPQMVEAVLYAMRRLEHLASPVSKRLTFAGRCPDCGAEVMARENQVEATCSECGRLVDVAESRARMLEVAASRPLPRSRAVEVAEVIVRRPIPDATVRSWCARGQLRPTPGPSLRRLYLASDIVELAEKRRAKQATPS